MPLETDLKGANISERDTGISWEMILPGDPPFYFDPGKDVP
ncbi:MAG TPA: hypothetical protein VJ695_10380 [Nitrososphaera sp.]|nr:hypothetical protein [Nitrososphaera sp.]